MRRERIALLAARCLQASRQQSAEPVVCGAFACANDPQRPSHYQARAAPLLCPTSLPISLPVTGKAQRASCIVQLSADRCTQHGFHPTVLTVTCMRVHPRAHADICNRVSMQSSRAFSSQRPWEKTYPGGFRPTADGGSGGAFLCPKCRSPVSPVPLTSAAMLPVEVRALCAAADLERLCCVVLTCVCCALCNPICLQPALAHCA